MLETKFVVAHKFCQSRCDLLRMRLQVLKENVSQAPFSLLLNSQKNQRQVMFSNLPASVADMVKFHDLAAQID